VRHIRTDPEARKRLLMRFRRPGHVGGLIVACCSGAAGSDALGESSAAAFGPKELEPAKASRRSFAREVLVRASSDCA
jgi:hypothetical protein